MSIIAFHGDPAIKSDAVARLRRHIDAGTFRYNPPWDNHGATALGAIAEDGGAEAYSERLGFPLALAAILDQLINDGYGKLDDAIAFALEWLEGTPVGADLSQVASSTLLVILSEPGLLELTGGDARMEQARLGVLDLHSRAMGGEDISRQTWKAARSEALAASDAAENDPLLRGAGAVAEAAAWPATMRTVLSDTISARGLMEVRRRLDSIGWTDELETRIFYIMKDAGERFAEIAGVDRVHAILEADHPELAPRFKLRLKQMEQLGDATAAIGRHVLDQLAEAPDVTA